MITAMLGALGASTRQLLADWGFAARLFFKLLGMSGAALKRFALVRDQIHFLGNYSLAIITVSGLFVGFVLGLQGYYTLQRYGSAEALGLLVALSLVRELGPVVAALLFAGRAGASLTGLHAAKRAFRNAARDFTNPTEQMAASKIMDALDRFVKEPDPATVVAGPAAAAAKLQAAREIDALKPLMVTDAKRTGRPRGIRLPSKLRDDADLFVERHTL